VVAAIWLLGATTAQAAPTVSSLAPHEGHTGTLVTIEGTEMESVTKVTFQYGVGGSGIAGTELTHISPTAVSVRAAPLVSGGTANVTVHDELGDEVLAGTFEYVRAPGIRKVSPKKGPAAGGTVVTISGNNMGRTSEVLFGSVPGTIESKSPQTLVAIAPPHTVGKVGITLVNPGGSSGPSNQATFTFSGVAVSGVSPASGGLAGGTPVTVTGSGFAAGAGTTSFAFGKTAATVVECASSTQCTMIAPAASKATTVDVRASVIGAKGTSKKSPADHYTYE
jgi:hypothetical protein